MPATAPTLFSDLDPLRCATHIARKLIEEVLPSNPAGFTFDPRAMRCVDRRGCRDEDYIVSVRGLGVEFQHEPREAELEAWLRTNAEILMTSPFLVGGWRNQAEGTYYLDVSMVIHGLRKAACFGARQGQRCIYHPASGRCVDVADVLGDSVRTRVHDEVMPGADSTREEKQ